MKRYTNQRKNRSSKMTNHQKPERLLPAEVRSKASNMPESGGYVGQRWYPQRKAKS